MKLLKLLELCLKVILAAVRLSENIKENDKQEALRVSENDWFER